MNIKILSGKIRKLYQRHSLKAVMAGVLALCFATSISSVPAFDGRDYSRSYGFGATVRAPSDVQPSGGRDIINMNGNVEASGILGCSGLDLDTLVGGQFGGIGNIGDLSKDIANAAKTRMFNEALAQLFSDPQVASVLENIQGMAQMKIGMLQKNCDETAIMADVTNKRLTGEATQRCVNERRSMEECSQPEILTTYLGEVVESPRWRDDLHTQLCDSEEQDNCDWTLMVPNKRTEIRQSDDEDEEDEETPADPDAPADPTDEPNDDADEENADADQVPAADTGEEVPAAISTNDIIRLAYDNALEDVVERVKAARDAVEAIGYSQAMNAVLYDQPGLPPILEEYRQEQQQRVSSGEITADDVLTPEPYTFYQYRTNEACDFSFSTHNNFDFDLTPIVGELPASDTPAPETPSEPTEVADPETPAPAPTTAPTPAPTSGDGRGRIIFPIAGKSNADTVVTSYYNQVAGRPAGATKPHVGIDYRARNAETILAVYDGRAAHGPSRHCGDVYVRRTINGRNEAFRYFHMRNPVNNAVMGRDVTAGTRVGTAGARCAGFAHLHVEYYVNGVRRNPAILLGFSPFKGGGNTSRYATAEDRRLAGSSLSGFSPELGENPHGEESLAATRSGLPADHPFVIALQNQMDQLAIRVSNTAKCMTNKLFHPQVYVKMAVMPGKVGYVGENYEVSDDMPEDSMVYDLQGDAGAMVNGVAQAIAYDAAVATYNATIMDMTQTIAVKGSEGEGGMNPAMYEYAKGHLALLQLRRATVISDYKAACALADKVTGVNDRLGDLRDITRYGNKQAQKLAELNKGIPLNCDKYDHLKDGSVDDLRKLYTDWSSDAVAPDGQSYPVDDTNELDCLARNIYFESRGESQAGQEAVAWATMNRVGANSHPASICQVVYQNNQFEWTQDNIPNDVITDQAAWARAQAIAQDIRSRAQAGEQPPAWLRGVTYFHTPACTCSWHRGASTLTRVRTEGGHIFYRENSLGRGP